MLTSQDIREIVRLTADTTITDLSRILDWTPARTQKAAYLNGGGIKSNNSPVDLKTARLLIRQAGREAALEDQIVQVHPIAIDEKDINGEAVFWKQRIVFWLAEAVRNFALPGRLPLEVALVMTDMAVSQLILGAHYAPGSGDDALLSIEGETPRFEWREILARFRLPSGIAPDAIETAFLNDLHAARNDVIHNLAPFLLDRDSVYLWLFLTLALAVQWDAAPDATTPGIAHFMPALDSAGEEIRIGCVDWLKGFIPTLLSSELGAIQVHQNLDGRLGLTDDLGKVFTPDIVITSQDSQRYSAQVEVPATLNSLTAHWWAYFQPSMVFIPLGYMARARSLARLTHYPEDRLMAYISPALESEPTAGR